MAGHFDDQTVDEGMAQLDQLMRLTLATWHRHEANALPPASGALEDALYAEHLIDNESYDSLQRLRRLHAKGEARSFTETLQVRALLDELEALFRSLANGPTLGKRHNAIIPLWMQGVPVEEIAERHGMDEQRVLVLLHEVVRYYELSGLEALKEFLANRQ